MSDNIEHLILEQLRQLREHQERMMGEIRELKMGFVSLNHHYRGVEWAQATHGEAIENVRKRLDRIERRLELSEPDPTSPTGLSESGTPYQPPPRQK
jgi:hypothetical protein